MVPRLASFGGATETAGGVNRRTTSSPHQCSSIGYSREGSLPASGRSRTSPTDLSRVRCHSGCHHASEVLYSSTGDHEWSEKHRFDSTSFALTFTVSVG